MRLCIYQLMSWYIHKRTEIDQLLGVVIAILVYTAMHLNLFRISAAPLRHVAWLPYASA